jgi:glucuronyl/N-acetylglucosaminyl transferase EXT2
MVGSTEPKEVAPITKDFLAILESIVESDFYTEDPKEACVFVPAINLINEAQVDPEAGARALPLIAGPSWNDGVNNLLFSFVTGHPDGLRMDHGAAMVAASGLSSFSYRSGFDVALPSYSILQEKLAPATRQNRDILLLSSQGNDLHEKYRPMLEDLTNLGDKATAVLNRCTDDSDAAADQIRCDDHKYLQTLSRAKFCLIGREKQSGLTSPALLEAMHSGCVPVILVDSLVLPFSDVLDWKRFSLRLFEHDAASRVFQVISNISDARHQEMQTQVKFIYSQYFKDLKTITETTLKILNDRVFPHHASNYRYVHTTYIGIGRSSGGDFRHNF